MFLHRIQNRIIFFFVFLIIVILLVSGWFLHWMIRQSLETELGRKLIAVANAGSVQFSEEEIGFLMQGRFPRVQQRLREQCIELKNATEVERIVFFDNNGNCLLDTEEISGEGKPYFRLRFYPRELDEVRSGKSSVSILFQGIDGRPAMTGYAPLRLQGQVIGGIGVEGSVPFLQAMTVLRRRLYGIGIFGTFAAVVLGWLLAKSITRPIGRLVQISERIGRGDYTEPVPVSSKSEVGRLAATMEEMRKGIIGRENEAKAMLAGVAHEIRNPLGGIELFTGILADETAHDPELKPHVERIAQEVHHLKHIVDSFLFYAKPQKPEKDSCSLHGAVIDVVHLLENELGDTITADISETLDDAEVWADPYHLKQILLNLMQNAIQAMPGGGCIRLSCEKNHSAVSIRIQDEGNGIPEDIQDRIFTPFFTTHEKGTGLGLSIVKGLVEANGGKIELVRSSSSGTEFRISLKASR